MASETCREVELAEPIPSVEWAVVRAALVATELAATMVVATELTEAIANTRQADR